jgi:hypothetical protein
MYVLYSVRTSIIVIIYLYYIVRQYYMIDYDTLQQRERLLNYISYMIEGAEDKRIRRVVIYIYHDIIQRPIDIGK